MFLPKRDLAGKRDDFKKFYSPTNRWAEGSSSRSSNGSRSGSSIRR
jgi:hypothetical protein